MEAEVNTYYTELLKDKKSHDQLLTNQLQRLLMCFDVYLETEADGSSSCEFGRDKIFPRTSRYIFFLEDNLYNFFAVNLIILE